jgi:hypothetical protein
LLALAHGASIVAVTHAGPPLLLVNVNVSTRCETETVRKLQGSKAQVVGADGGYPLGKELKGVLVVMLPKNGPLHGVQGPPP